MSRYYHIEIGAMLEMSLNHYVHFFAGKASQKTEKRLEGKRGGTDFTT